jgi:hypothetical protein
MQSKRREQCPCSPCSAKWKEPGYRYWRSGQNGHSDWKHDQGCVFAATWQPDDTSFFSHRETQPIDPLPYLGRVLTLAAATALEHLSASDFASDYLLLPVGVREC